MATPLDIGLLQHFDVIFPMLFVFTITYAFLNKFNVLGEKKDAWNAMVALAFAMMVLVSPIAVKTVFRAAPQFALLMVMIFFLVFAFKSFGVSDTTITDAIQSESRSFIKATFIFIIVGIVAMALMSAISEEQGFQSLTEAKNDAQATISDGSSSTTTSGGGALTEQQELFKTIFHPKVLGLVAIILVMTFAAALLAGAPEKDSK